MKILLIAKEQISECKLKKKKLMNLKIDEQKLFNLKDREKKDWRKTNTHSVAFGTISNGIIYVYLESQRERRERREQKKNIRRKIFENFSLL